MSVVFTLIKRDLRNNINKKLLMMLIFLLIFQFWFILGSDSVNQVEESGTMNYMAIVFSFNFFGSIVALALNYDGISCERESKFLDLILTSGVTKKKFYFSKVLTSFIISGTFAVSYIFVIMLIYLTISGNIEISLLSLRYIMPLTAFLSLFSLMGLTISIILRSSVSSLITSIIIGGVLMPRLFIMVIDSLNSIFRFGEKTIEILYMLSPALIMNALNGYSETVYFLWGLILLAVYFTAVIFLGMFMFERQDELNSGE